MSSSLKSAQRRGVPEPVRLTNWPLRDDGLRARAMAAGIAVLAVLTGWVAGSGLMGLLFFALLAASAWRLWVPVTFDFSARGIVQTCWTRQRRVPWFQIARYEVLTHGILLSADAESTALSPLRGIYIRWNDQRDELLRVVKFFMDSKDRVRVPTTAEHKHS